MPPAFTRKLLKKQQNEKFNKTPFPRLGKHYEKIFAIPIHMCLPNSFKKRQKHLWYLVSKHLN